MTTQESDEIWCDFGAGFYSRFNVDRSACFKVISQMSLFDAKAWSAYGKIIPHLWFLKLQISPGKYTLF